jgi:predicted Rossmann fold nucleotide-binding protein DprA/Smf involved in DNA uptake
MVSAMGAGARSEDALAALLLTTRLGDPEPAPLSPARYWALVAAAPAPAELLTEPASDIAGRTGFPHGEALQVERLLTAGTSLAFSLERLERQGFVAVTSFDPGYPARLRERLGDQAPPVLFTVGERELLSSEGVGVVGSRAVTPEGADVARRVSARAAAEGLTTVSGGARGVDQESMSAANGAGGRVLGYVADSLLGRVREPSTRRAVADGTVCLATPSEPSAGFSAANAIGRNKLIYASARVTLVVACDLGRGGTWAGATEALRSGYGVVAVWVGPGAGPGNARLVEQGAAPVDQVEAVFSDPTAGPGPTRGPDQLRFGW